MERKEIGKFYATSFDEKVYEFIVYNNNTIDCPTMDAKDVFRFILKPRFMMFSKDKTYRSPAKTGTNAGLIKTYDISKELLQYLRANNMIMFSTDMAFLYNFEDKNGYDKPKHNGRAYKKAIKKGPILVKQKSGIYN